MGTEAMDHEATIQAHAVDRYLLGQMNELERDEFEEHFFSCTACADEVRTGFLLKENARVVIEEPAPKRIRWWSFPVLVPSFAALALAAVVLFQNAVTLPELRLPQALGPAVILDGVTRDSLPQLNAGAPLRFQMAVDQAAAGDSLRVELVDDSGGTVRSGVVAAPGPDRPLDVFFPGKLRAGRYTLVVRSNAAGSELSRSPFRVTSGG